MPGRGREKGRMKIQRMLDDKKRHTALKRRLPVLTKKAGELAGLCDVPVCLIVYPPNEAKPVVWPSRRAAADVVRRYRGLPHLDRSRNKLDSLDFVKDINDKLKLKLCKVQLQRREAEIKIVIADFVAGRRDRFDDLPIDFFVSIGMKVQEKLQAITARLQEIRSASVLPEDVQTSEPLAVMQPLSPLPMVATLVPRHDVTMTPLMLEPPPEQHDGRTLMTLDGEPRHGSYLFQVPDAFNDPGDGSALPNTEEMHAIFQQAGIFSPPLQNPSFDP
nr:agamous-like MADS-box protein AGL80 [Lolium perenne]